MQEKIFLLGGRTGGPLTPLIATSSQLPYRVFIVGVKNGYEKKVADQKRLTFLALPETKLSGLSFAQDKWKIIYQIPVQLFILCYSIILSIIYLLQYQPKAILGAGGFTTVPIVIAVKLLRIFGFSTKIIIHQQDPLVGLSNKIGLNFADYSTYVYPQYLSKPYLQKSKQIPNPIAYEAFNSEVQTELMEKYPIISNFFSNKLKPVLLIFGGGSGAKVINNWVINNSKELLEYFDIIHLTGLLQYSSFIEIPHPRYLRLEFAMEEMPILMKQSDLVLCRAGLGSISELTYLQKPTFLVPIKNSHQEINADVVSQYMVTIPQDQLMGINFLLQHYPNSFIENKFPITPDFYSQSLRNYYSEIEHFLESPDDLGK
jgi:UDP-N-acetylglucosamine--N-acetylmuramyl-(pentapeptide) pyrophosphoryl-undecaprenol N-acetylglucosamine transferase